MIFVCFRCIHIICVTSNCYSQAICLCHILSKWSPFINHCKLSQINKIVIQRPAGSLQIIEWCTQNPMQRQEVSRKSGFSEPDSAAPWWVRWVLTCGGCGWMWAKACSGRPWSTANGLDIIARFAGGVVGELDDDVVAMLLAATMPLTLVVPPLVACTGKR